MTNGDARHLRIELTARECEALREVREFFNGLVKDTVGRVGGNTAVRVIRRELWEMCNGIGRHAQNGSFTPVDFTPAQCKTGYDACLYVSELLTAELQTGATNLRAEMFATVLVGLKAKFTAASQLAESRWGALEVLQ